MTITIPSCARCAGERSFSRISSTSLGSAIQSGCLSRCTICNPRPSPKNGLRRPLCRSLFSISGYCNGRALNVAADGSTAGISSEWIGKAKVTTQSISPSFLPRYLEMAPLAPACLKRSRSYGLQTWSSSLFATSSLLVALTTVTKHLRQIELIVPKLPGRWQNFLSEEKGDIADNLLHPADGEN